MYVIILLATTACSFLITNASPLYEERFKQPGAKVILPDPLEVAPSVELQWLHNNNYDESMQYQNFETFFDPKIKDLNNEYNMEESKFVYSNPLRPPQPLSEEERRIRQKLEDVDEKHEKKQLLKLEKGSSKPRINAPQWDQFDYDYYSVNPEKKHKKSYYG